MPDKLPAKAGILAAVGRLIFNNNVFSRNVPELTRDIGQDGCFRAAGGGQPVIARVFRNRGVQESG